MKKVKIDFLFLSLISVFFFSLMIFDVNSWYYSAIGDEYAFFNLAKKIATDEAKVSVFFIEKSLNIFDQKGVYEIAPVATSFYQASIMKVFGINHYGWIISSILIVIFSFWPFYFATKELFNRKTAIFSLSIFASSHYLWAFSHLGYWNIQGLFPAITAFYFFLRGLKRKSAFLLLFSGIFTGLCFYTNYFSRITIFLIILYLTINRQHLKQIKGLFFFLIGFLIFFIPYLYVNHNSIVEPILKRSLIASEEIPREKRGVLFFQNLWGSFLAFYQNSKTSHFVSGSLIDPISGFLFSLGTIFTITSWRKYYFLILSFLIVLIMIGGFSQYIYVPVSRLYFILPIIALIAGYGLKRFLDVLKQYISSRISSLILIAVIISVLVLNINRFFYQTPRLFQATSEAVAIKAFKEICFSQKLLLLTRAHSLF